MIPISTSCLHRRTVHIHKNLFDARNEPAVQVLRTTGLPVGGDEAVLMTNAGGKSAVQVLKTTGLWSSEDVLDNTTSDEPAVQVLKTTRLPASWWQEAVINTTAGRDNLQISPRAHRS